MSVSQLPNGRWRAQVYNPEVGKSVSAAKILGLDEPSFGSKREAERARERARERLTESRAADAELTVGRWWEIWTTNENFQRPKPATNLNNKALTKAFCEQYATRLMVSIDRDLVSDWLLQSPKNASAVKCLRTMWSDAMEHNKVQSNPFIRRGIKKTSRAAQQPPSKEMVWKMIAAAQETSPSFSAWLQVACFSGMRPAELDGLRWEDVDFDGGWIHVRQQFCSTGFVFVLPKNGLTRKVPMHEPARRALLSLPRDESGFVFVNGRGTHWTKPARTYHWNKVRKATGWTESLYLATRHFAAMTMYQIMRLPAEDVASALGHTDRGDLVRKLYGHHSDDDALERVKQAYLDAEGETDELAAKRRRKAA